MKSKLKFYPAASRHLSMGTPIPVIYEMTKEYDITKEEIDSYIETKTRTKAMSLALMPVTKEEQKALYNTLDKRFIDRYKTLVTYRLGDNVFFYNYDGGVYKQVSDTDIEDLIDGYMFELGLLEDRNSRRKITDTTQRIASLLSRTEGRHFKNEDIVGRQLKLNLKNGLLNMKTHKLTPHTPNYFSTAQVPFDYDPEAKAPKFEGFIDLVSSGDQTTKDMIQEMFGYCIGEGNPRHKVFYLYGDTARNGKSTTAKILCGLIGDDNYSTLSLGQIANGNSSQLVSLIGKQLNFSDEISSKYIESSMLTAMAAEGVIEINPKYKSPFMYQVRSKFVVACNDLPKFQNGQGMKHRMIIIPFQYFIPEGDRILRFDEVLLEEEGSGILNWAIQGNKMLEERKVFTISEQSAEDMHDNVKESNSVYAFLYDTYDFDEKHTEDIRKKAMYGKYKDYCFDCKLMAKSYLSFCTEAKRFSKETLKMQEVRKYSEKFYTGIKELDLLDSDNF